MPQTSSSGMSQRHVATAAHFLILTFMLLRVAVPWAGKRASVWRDSSKDTDKNRMRVGRYGQQSRGQRLGGVGKAGIGALLVGVVAVMISTIT